MIFFRRRDQLRKLESLGYTRLRTVVIIGSIHSGSHLPRGVVLDYGSRVMSPRRPGQVVLPRGELARLSA